MYFVWTSNRFHSQGEHAGTMVVTRSMRNTQAKLAAHVANRRMQRKRKHESSCTERVAKIQKTSHFVEVLEWKSIMCEGGTPFVFDMHTVHAFMRSDLHDVAKHPTLCLALFSPPDVYSPLSSHACYHVSSSSIATRLHRVATGLSALATDANSRVRLF